MSIVAKGSEWGVKRRKCKLRDCGKESEDEKELSEKKQQESAVKVISGALK